METERSMMVDEKIDQSGPKWYEWGQFLDDNIAPARHVIQALPSPRSIEERNEQVRAMLLWIMEYRTDTITIHQHPDSSLNLRWHSIGKPGEDLIEGLAGLAKDLDMSVVISLRPIDKDLHQKVLAAEREWFATSPTAPVAKAFFTAQENVGNDFRTAYDSDGKPIEYTWDATAALLSTPHDERSDAMEKDTYASDALRDHDDANPEARDWDGPYLIEALLYPPSLELIALRQAADLRNATPAAHITSSKPRI